MPRAATYQALISFVIAAIAFYRMQRISPATSSRMQWVPLGRKWKPIAFLSIYLVGIRIPLIPFSDLTFDKVLDVAVFLAGVALVEEALFRGWLFARLERLNQWFAIIVSSILFGLMHAINFRSPLSDRYVVVQIFVAMTFGYIFAALMLYTGSIWVPIVMHFAMDFPAFLFASLDQFGAALPTDNGKLATAIIAICGVNIIIGSLFLKNHFAAVQKESEVPVLQS